MLAKRCEDNPALVALSEANDRRMFCAKALASLEPLFARFGDASPVIAKLVAVQGLTLGRQNAGPVCRIRVADLEVDEYPTAQAAAAADGGPSSESGIHSAIWRGNLRQIAL